MNSRTRIWLLSLVWLVCLPFAARAQGSDTLKLRVQVEGGDTVLLASLREVNVFAPMHFKNKREERFYWRTVRDVKRTLPYAKRVAAEVQRANRDLLYNALTADGFTCIPSEGAFYLFMKSPEPDAAAFAERAKKYELLLVPSDSFGVKGYVRISYCVARETIEGSLPAFRQLAEEYGL